MLMEKRPKRKSGSIILGDCGYISTDKWRSLVDGYEEVGRMLGGMIARPERFKA